MMRKVFLLFLLPFAVTLWGQATYVLRGIVRDATTHLPLHDVHIAVKGTQLGVVSDADGHFELRLRQSESMDLLASRVGYTDWEQRVDVSAIRNEVHVIISLVPSTVDLPEAIIKRPRPEVVYQRDDLHVGDYFPNTDGVWVLTYEKPKWVHRADQQGRQVFRDARLHLLDTTFTELCSVRLPTDVCRLHHDAEHRVIVEGVRCAWVAAFRDGEVVLQEISLQLLQEQVLPWTDSIPGRLLGSDHDDTFPAFTHFAFEVSEHYTHTICTVQDDFRMELFRSQYKYMSGHDKVVAMDLALETGIDAEIIAGHMTGFHHDIYFEPPYAPLFVVHDTLCVFDQYKELIRRFLPDGTEVGAVPITFQRNRYWKTRLLHDRNSGAVYAVFARNLRTWLREVDVGTGQLGPERVLDDPFPEQVRVHGDHAYFIYRPAESLQHRTLYRQRIR